MNLANTPEKSGTAKTGLVLVNIGSPSTPQVPDVKSYLQNFLMDPRVISLPFVWRWILVNLIIVPRRAKISAKNYAKIWLEKENQSPLIHWSQKFAELLQQELKADYVVRPAMQYSEPYVPKVLEELKSAGIKDFLVVPMFPQFAEATSGSVKESVRALFKSKALKDARGSGHSLRFAPVFFREFTAVHSRVALQKLYGKDIDHYLFSFHGLPENQILKDPKCRLQEDCCRSDGCERNCYRAQCFKTAELMAEQMRIPPEKYTVSFQSRFGRTQWLKPYTSDFVRSAPTHGIKKLAVLCPAFVVDCLETLEEIGLGERENFIRHGGSEFHLVPCPNASTEWARQFAEFIRALPKT